MMKWNRNNPPNLFDKNSQAGLRLSTTTSKYITFQLHAPPTMPLIERDYNYRWNYPSRIVDEHRRPNTTIKYRAHVHWNAWANSKIECFAMLTFQNPSTTSKSFDYFPTSLPPNHLETVFQKRAADFQHKTRP